VHVLYAYIRFSVPDKSKEPESRQFVGLVIGILTTVIVMLLAAIMFIFYRNRRLKAALAPSSFYDQQGDLKVRMETTESKLFYFTSIFCPAYGTVSYSIARYKGIGKRKDVAILRLLTYLVI